MPERKEDTVVIFASPHKDGDTKKLLNLFLEKEGISDYLLFDCFDEMPQPCDACNACMKRLTCSKTDLKDFFRTFNECRRLIIATPVFNGGLPAPLKALADRSQIYYNARFCRNERGIAQKKDAVILLTGGSPTDKTQAILETLLPIFSVTSCTLKGCYALWGTDNNAPMPCKESLPSFQ